MLKFLIVRVSGLPFLRTQALEINALQEIQHSENITRKKN